MNLKKRLLKKSRLYVIIDSKAAVNKIKHSGADIIQLRCKDSRKEDTLRAALSLHKSLLKSKTLFIINDFLDIAKIACCDGIHLGQDDASIETARRILGPDKIIGQSCHSLKQAQKAQCLGADYISVGPVFPTPTKPEYKAVGLSLLEEIRGKIKIPFFAIGGINEENLSRVMSAGAKRIAVYRAIAKAGNIKLAAQRFLVTLHR